MKTLTQSEIDRVVEKVLTQSETNQEGTTYWWGWFWGWMLFYGVIIFGILMWRQ